nr:MAG TPA: hypothetical protein [Caudoviricetes sp.]
MGKVIRLRLVVGPARRVHRESQDQRVILVHRESQALKALTAKRVSRGKMGHQHKPSGTLSLPA